MKDARRVQYLKLANRVNPVEKKLQLLQRYLDIVRKQKRTPLHRSPNHISN